MANIFTRHLWRKTHTRHDSLTNTKETNSSYFCFTSSFFLYLPPYFLTYLNPSKFSRIYLQPKVEKLSILPTIVVQSLLYWNRLSLWLIPHFSVLYLTQYYLESCCVFNIYDQKIWVRSLWNELENSLLISLLFCSKGLHQQFVFFSESTYYPCRIMLRK